MVSFLMVQLSSFGVWGLGAGRMGANHLLLKRPSVRFEYKVIL